MNQRLRLSDTVMASLTSSGVVGRWMLAGAVFGLSACGSGEAPSETEEVAGTTEQAVTAMPTDGSCGFKVTSKYFNRRHGNGYIGELELKNVSGPKATKFEVFADLGGASIRRDRCLFGDCDPVEGGYSITEPALIRILGIRQGATLPILYGSPDPYAGVSPYVISINGQRCDTVAPTVSLAADRTLISSTGTLKLTATASDNVAVRKVVFFQDGVKIGEDTAAPFALDVAATAALNGRHTFTAVAHDPSGNTKTSNGVKVLTGIGNKFFGTAVDTAADYTQALTYFNQITPGNSGKWGSVEATRDVMNWTALDTAYQFAKQNNLPFKLHTLVWGQQQPAWLAALTPAEQLAEIQQWFAAAAARYPDVQQVDVVNEPLHAVPGYAAALGGAGATGFDWAIKAFELARTHFPKAELLVNDYNVEGMEAFATDYLRVINILKERGLVDGIGLQAHFLEKAEISVVAANLERFAATGLPIYVTELDVNYADDARQAQRMRDLFKLFWQHPSVFGVTHWGYLQGNMWQSDAYLVRSDGTRRPALDYIICLRGGGTNCTVPAYVPQPRTGDSGGITLQAEDYDDAKGIYAAGSVIAYVDNGDHERFDRVMFDKNWDTLSITYANGSTNATSLSLRLGSVDGPAIATVQLPSTGGWGNNQTISVPFAPQTGEQTLFVTFNGGVNVDKYVIGAPAGLGPNLVANGEFEQNTNGWFSWDGTLSVTNTSAASGASSLRSTARGGNGPIATSLTGLVQRGKTYEVALYSSINGAASANVNITQAISCDGSPAYSWLINPTAVQQGQWTKLTGQLKVPDCNVTDVMIFAEGPAGGIDLLIDHVSVRGQLATNLVSNGTFENGTTNGWYTYSGVASNTTARAHSGSRSLLIGNRTGNAPAVTDITAAVTKGQSYAVSFWVTVGNAASANVNITQKLVCDGNTTYTWLVNPVAVSDGVWTELKGTVNVPNCTNLQELQLFAEGPAAGVDLYVDDVSVSVPVVTNLISDGDFEAGQGGWFTWGGGTLATTAARAHGGSRSLGFTGRTGNGPIARSLMGIVQSGKSYQVSMWASVGGVASANINVTTAMGCNGSDTYAWIVNPTTVSDGGWTKLTGTINVPSCANITNALVFAEGPGAGVDMYIDDVVVSP